MIVYGIFCGNFRGSSYYRTHEKPRQPLISDPIAVVLNG